MIRAHLRLLKERLKRLQRERLRCAAALVGMVQQSATHRSPMLTRVDNNLVAINAAVSDGEGEGVISDGGNVLSNRTLAGVGALYGTRPAGDRRNLQSAIKA